MSLIRAWVDGNAFRSESFTIQCDVQYVRNISAAGVTEGGNFVDVDTEFCVIVHGCKTNEKAYVCVRMREETIHTEPITPLRPTDLVVEALDQMEEWKLSHLPLVSIEGMYMGLIREDALLESEDDNAPVSTVFNPVFAPSVLPKAHPFTLMDVCTRDRITLIPIVDDQGAYVGAHLLTDVLEFFRATPALSQPGAVLVMRTELAQYSLAEMAAVVEQNDAKILASWLTQSNAMNEVEITLKINVEHSGPIVQSLQRYGYEIGGIFGDRNFDSDYRERYDHLMNYLKY